MTQFPAKPQRSIQQFPIRRLAIALILVLIALVSAIPHYFNGQWAWSSDPEVPQIQQLRSLRDNGLDLPNWTEAEQAVLPIGNHKWSFQNMEANSPTADPAQFLLFILPQDWHDKQPQVEWIDLNGFLGRALNRQAQAPDWQTDSVRRLQFSVDDPTRDRTVTINARYLRGWNQQATYALLQWYTWPDGGSASAKPWFWADQRSQLRQGERTPWVAASVILPIKPFGNLDDYRTQISELGQAVQVQLLEQSLNPSAS